MPWHVAAEGIEYEAEVTIANAKIRTAGKKAPGQIATLRRILLLFKGAP